MVPGDERARCLRPLALAALAILASTLLSGCSSEGWKRWERRNCFHGRGGSKVSDDTNPIPGAMSLEECQERCAASSECWGVQMLQEDAESTGGCYFRKELDPADCWHSDVIKWNLYVRPGDDHKRSTGTTRPDDDKRSTGTTRPADYMRTSSGGVISDNVVQIFVVAILICLVTIALLLLALLVLKRKVKAQEEYLRT